MGYKSGPMRYEAQFTYIRGSHNKIAGVTANGGTNVYAFMANVYFDFDMINFQVVPYIGAGLGYAHLTDSALAGSSDSVFAYQGMAGLRYHFEENITFDFGYRYFGTTEADSQFKKRWQSNLVNLGVTFNFG